MTQYINKDALVAEIESLRRTTFTNFDEGINATVQTLLETLDTLEVKEVDLNEEIEKCLKRHNMLAVGKKDFTDIAKHFFELGLKAAQNERKSCTTDE